MKINLEALSDHELADLVAAVAEEWKLRQRQDHKTVIKRNPAMKPRVVEIDEPTEDDKQFVLYVKALAMKGQLVRAAERRRVAEIAERHEAWVVRQGLPTEGGTGAWRELARRIRVGVAGER